MKIKLYFSLLLITLISCIIIPGCGGGSNSINPASSITTSTPAISNNAVGYLTINIVWPQSGIQGKCSILSKNTEKDITASMPVDTSLIYIKIRDANEPNTNITLDPNGLYIFHRSPGEDTISRTMGPFPVIKVKIRSEAYDSQNSTPISVAEQEFQIKPGNPSDNTVDLALGDYDLTLTADPNSIVLGDSTVSGSNLISNVAALPTPTPGRTVIKNNLTPMNPCVAEITPEGSPLPTDTPTPTPTPIRVSRDIKATLMIKYPTPTVNSTANTDNTTPPTPTPKFVANKQITFTLIEGNDEYTTLSLELLEKTIESDTVTGTTNNNGTCTIKLLAGTAGDKVIKAFFMADPNDPNSVRSDKCTVIVITPTPTPTPIRTPTNVPMNVAGNWEDSGNEAGYTITQSGRELTFTCIYPGNPSTPTPTGTPPSINPTPTLRPLPSEGSWIGLIYEDNSISMWPPYHESMLGKVKIYSGELHIIWVGESSNRYYNSWIRK